MSSCEYKDIISYDSKLSLSGGPRGREVKSADFSLPHLTIRSSHGCVWCGLELHTGLSRQAKFCLRAQVVDLFCYKLSITFEPPHGKTNNLHMQKQIRRSASQ